jgi:hypothetical protein
MVARLDREERDLIELASNVKGGGGPMEHGCGRWMIIDWKEEIAYRIGLIGCRNTWLDKTTFEI